MPETDFLLARFQALCDPGPFQVPFVHHRPGEGTHVVFGFGVHGDEVGSIPAAIAILEALQDGTLAPKCPVSLFIGNPEAIRQGRRQVAFDLNRAWVFEHERTGPDHDRARELRPLLDAADLFIDFHQTALPTRSGFWTFPWNRTYGDWARILRAAPVGLTRAPGLAFASAELKCIDEYVRDAGRVGITVELGQRGFDPVQARTCEQAVHRALAAAAAIDEGAALDGLAADAPPIRWFTTVHREDWGAPERALREGLANWTGVRAGQDLAAPGSPAITVPSDGVLLFPKYLLPGDPIPTHLFHLAQPIEGSPEALWGRIDAAIRG